MSQESQETTREHNVGDVWLRRYDGETFELKVTGKFNDWCLEMRDALDPDAHVGVYPLYHLKQNGWLRRTR